MYNQKTNKAKIFNRQAINISKPMPKALFDRFQLTLLLIKPKNLSQFGIFQVLSSLDNLILRKETWRSLNYKTK